MTREYLSQTIVVPTTKGDKKLESCLARSQLKKLCFQDEKDMKLCVISSIQEKRVSERE